jgi:hypothetical protein
MRSPLLLALLPVAFAAASVVACSSTPDPPREVTFHADVEPILQKRCQGCHNPSGIAPMALVTYDDMKVFGRTAFEKVRDRVMPPWGAYDDDTCKMKHQFRDDLRMSQDEIDTMGRWVDQGMKEGSLAAAPPPKTFAKGGLLDATSRLGLKQPFKLKGGAADDIRCFPLDPGFAQDTYISATNVLPGNPKVVHHVIVYTDPKQEAKSKVDATGTYPCFGSADVSNQSLVLAWAPGVPPASYAEVNAALKIPANAHLVMQVHYHPAETDQEDSTQFELKAMNGRPPYEAQVLLAGNATSTTSKLLRLLPGADDPAGGAKFYIPAGKDRHAEVMELELPEIVQNRKVPIVRLYAAGAHMHWAGVDMKIEIERKDPPDDQAKRECLLGTPRYDFNWQRGYAYQGEYQDLPTLGPGDKVKLTCTYNNSMSNPYIRKALSEKRLSAPVPIELGEETLDEMCLGAFIVLSPPF